MPKIELSNGPAMLRVHHTELEVPEGHSNRMDGSDKEKHRATVVSIDLPDGKHAESRAICRPPDQFNRATGRRLAANRLLQELREGGVPTEDRRTIFTKICPEYAGE